ncbi:DUF4157 domain-containing protein [Xanthovirga aplysinae]|uniref:eCIS core domain-containing protein n=1 Tax=Xanthovirga aplysinae TaxID=2529853 RepID=UPI0012BC5912|nr:DUF4157 domain-containing protein [Xanthovirga aplysinae]MTI29869.1 DUF4157 domain-containing protein [Xanthovirga aplysinae]
MNLCKSPLKNRGLLPKTSDLPSSLKNVLEKISGIAMGDVKVYYNSTKPAHLQAFAYAQGSDIYLGPKQEKHLAHEAWHIVQQKQGRVSPRLSLCKEWINDEQELEIEAELMAEILNQIGNVEQNFKVQALRKVNISNSVLVAQRVKRNLTDAVKFFKNMNPDEYGNLQGAILFDPAPRKTASSGGQEFLEGMKFDWDGKGQILNGHITLSPDESGLGNVESAHLTITSSAYQGNYWFVMSGEVLEPGPPLPKFKGKASKNGNLIPTKLKKEVEALLHFLIIEI